ncbi:MAG: glycoside hydrolase family 1 protein [Akkermansiaceae bacterium]|nr:glycoside hydrolase family 1 protein [Akkermansiaceae bacterium]
MVARYHAIFSAIRKAGLEPVATLHHFVHPKWFEDIGGFLEETNLPLFVKFCELAVREFSTYVTQWVTFNEPAVICITGYWFGIFPPGASPHLQALRLLLSCEWCCCEERCCCMSLLVIKPHGSEGHVLVLQRCGQPTPHQRHMPVPRCDVPASTHSVWAICRAAYSSHQGW